MIFRPDYIKAIEPFIDKPLVKILAGVRRCGKSTIFEMLKAELIDRGTEEARIIHRSYTDMDMPENITAKEMYAELTAAMQGKGRCYLLLDEIQEIKGWEKAVNSLLENTDADIYVTGSNSKLMSSEISTYLTGRYVTIPVYTLSFKEYIQFKAESGRGGRELLNEYIRFGGFPITAIAEYEADQAYQIVNGIYYTVVSRDIVKRHRIAKQELFDRVVKYIIENVGKTFSANSISVFLKSEHRSASVESIYNYIRWLEQAFIVYPCKRYDLQGKSILKTQEKYFLADMSLKYALLGYNRKMLDGAIENIVFLELKRRGYDVYIGGRSVIESVSRFALGLFNGFLEDAVCLPEFQNLFLSRNKVERGGNFFVHCSNTPFLLRKFLKIKNRPEKRDDRNRGTTRIQRHNKNHAFALLPFNAGAASKDNPALPNIFGMS